MNYLRSQTTQPLDEGFPPSQHKVGEEIFYRTPDWPLYKAFKGHGSGRLTDAQANRYDRHAGEIAKLVKDGSNVLSLGGGTGSLEQRIAKLRPGCSFTVSDIYDRAPVAGISFTHLDMVDRIAMKQALEGVDTVLISNAISPLMPDEVKAVFAAIGRSGAKQIIIYSSEDIRPLGYLLTSIKRMIKPKRALWTGYLYNSRYVASLAKSVGFPHARRWVPRERGFLTPVWGSTYLAEFTRTKTDRPDIIAVNMAM